MAKTENTRILDRFNGYSVADCDCTLCLYYGGKRRGCNLDKCCCAEERREAVERERFGTREPENVCRG